MVTMQRAKQILISYGANPKLWPVDERSYVLQQILTEPELQALLEQEQQLDKQLEALFSEIEQTDAQQLHQKILMNLPENEPGPDKQSISYAQLADGYVQRLKKTFNTLLTPSRLVTTGATLSMLVAVAWLQFYSSRPEGFIRPGNMDDELQLMAEAMDKSEVMELFALVEPELFDDDLDG